MRIDPDSCTACTLCIDYCPAEAIRIDPARPDTIYVSRELCFECGLCRSIKVCPVDALIPSDEAEKFPGVVAATFSNPNITHRCTRIPGRGTDESKTNDVSGRIKGGEINILIEFGRPGLGCTFRDISMMTRGLKDLGVQFEENNPLHTLMDSETGNFPDALLSQRIMSSIIEIKIKDTELEKVITTIMGVAQEIDTVFSLSVVCRFDKRGELPVLDKIAAMGIKIRENAKINLGMGRPLAKD